MLRKRGFTLVELLVVISIIALLISILAPSLKSARELVKENFCKTNFNALNKSVAVYSELNKGFMMVYKHNPPGYYLNAQGAYKQVWKTFVCYKWDTINPNNIDANTGVYAEAMGFGIVYAQKLLEPAEMFYCPSQTEEKSTRAYYGYDHPWGAWIPNTDDVNGSDFVRISYMYNPWVIKDINIANNVLYENKLVFAKHPNDRLVTGELMTKAENISHGQGNSVKWNMGFADGHVGVMSNRKDGARNLYAYLNRLKILKDAGQTGDPPVDLADDQWDFWGTNNPENTMPMGRRNTNNGNARFEILNSGSSN